MKQITINWGVNQSEGSITLDFEELGLTEEEWNEYSDDRKKDYIQYVLDEHDTCYGMVDDYTIE